MGGVYAATVAAAEALRAVTGLRQRHLAGIVGLRHVAVGLSKTWEDICADRTLKLDLHRRMVASAQVFHKRNMWTLSTIGALGARSGGSS